MQVFFVEAVIVKGLSGPGFVGVIRADVSEVFFELVDQL